MNIKPALLRAFVPFTGDLEGVVPWMYLDILALVTVAIGNLVDPLAYALGLPFVMPSGERATQDQIAAAWRAVKADPRAAKNGHRYAATIPGNNVRLTPQGVSEVVLAKFRQNHAALAARFPDFEDWFVDAQLATHSLAWACGSAFRFPRLEAALRARDFTTAAKECHMNENGADGLPNTPDDNWGIKPRNVANKTMFANAARGMYAQLDPDALIYPVKGVELIVPPDGHVAPRQGPVLPEEVTGSGGIIHPDIEWPTYRD